MVRSTLPYLCLWIGLRLISEVPALVRVFDTLTAYLWMIHSTDQKNPQTKLENYLRALRCLNLSSIGRQEEPLWPGNVPKNLKILDDKNKNLEFLWICFQIILGAFQDHKSSRLALNNTFFKQKIRARGPQLEAPSGNFCVWVSCSLIASAFYMCGLIQLCYFLHIPQNHASHLSFLVNDMYNWKVYLSCDTALCWLDWITERFVYCKKLTSSFCNTLDQSIEEHLK